MQRTMVATIKIVATAARDAMTIKHRFATTIDEQGWASVFCTGSVTLVVVAVLVDNIFVITWIPPPCVALVATEVDVFVEGILAVVVKSLENAVVRMWALVVDWFSTRVSGVAEKVLLFSSTDPVVTFTLEAGSSVMAVDLLNTLLVVFWRCLAVVADEVADPLLLFCGNTVDIELLVVAVKLVVKAGGIGAFAVVFAAVCGSVFSNIVVIVELFAVGCCPDVKAGTVSVEVFTGDVLASVFGNTVDFSSCDFASSVTLTLFSLAVVIMEGVSLCVGLSVPEALTLWANGFSLAFLVLSVEFRGGTA